MVLEGVITNVANFGAFVDIGVHQDGLVHISQLTNKFIKDPREVVRTGDVVKVRVEEVDVQRKRISLTMRLDDAGQKAPAAPKPTKPEVRKPLAANPDSAKPADKFARKKSAKETAAANSAMGDALAAAFAKLRQ